MNSTLRLKQQLEVLSGPGYTEYRVYPKSVSKRRLTENETSLSSLQACVDSAVAVLLAYLVYHSEVITGGHIDLKHQRFIFTFLILCIYICWRATQIQYESVVIFDIHGVQMETHRGPYPGYIFFTTRRFVPSVYIKDIFINEALRRGNVRYYLAILASPKKGKHELIVIFENILPHFPVVLEVYRGIGKILYSQDENH